MHKKQGKSLGFVIAATLFVLVVLFVVFWSAMEQTQRQGIVMPDEALAEVETATSSVEQEHLFLTVEPENIQQVLSTMARPGQYTQTFAVTSLWGEGSSASTVTIWRSGDLRKAEVVTELATRHLLTDGETLWLWYGADSQAEAYVCDETMTLDDLLAIPTYELVAELPAEAIVAGQYIPSSSDWTNNCLVITASQWEGGETVYWVDASTQILIGAQVSQNGVLQQTVTQTSLSFDEIEEAVFALPGGVTLETETPQP